MKLKGILDFSLGNFLCLRGFAPMGDLYDISVADPSFQRDLLKEHEKEMVAFLSDGEFLFFPEVILATTLFVSMPFGKPKQDDHYAIIEHISKDLTNEYNIRPALNVVRVDWFHDGTSYEISAKIIEMMSDCGLLRWESRPHPARSNPRCG